VNTRRVLSYLLVLSVLIFLFVGNVEARTYDFNTFSPGSYTETVFNTLFEGVTFDNTGGNDFSIRAITLQGDFSGNAVVNQPYNTYGNSTIATFSFPTNLVSVTMGDYGADDDYLYLFAYNSSNTLVGQATFTNPFSSYMGTTLSVSTTDRDIAWVSFYGVGNNNNSVFWDNFTFNEYRAPSVPVPPAVLLFGSGLLGIFGLRQRRSA